MKRDQKFYDMYSLVIGVLAIFSVGIYVLSTKMSDLTQGLYNADTEEYRAATEARLKPVGQVYLPGEELTATGPQVPATQQAEAVAAALSGPQVFNQACNVCHGNGIGGAPMLTDQAAWESRIAQGVDTLKDHAINGYAGSVGFMPPKGGSAALSDAEVYAAVEFMLAEVRGE